MASLSNFVKFCQILQARSRNFPTSVKGKLRQFELQQYSCEYGANLNGKRWNPRLLVDGAETEGGWKNEDVPLQLKTLKTNRQKLPLTFSAVSHRQPS